MQDIQQAKATVLAVDDEQGARLSLKMVLRGRYNVITCSSGDEALAALSENKISVAILDIKMADESGLDLLQRLKKADPLLECIMLTGYETVDAAKTALRHGACEFLSKPFDVPGLLEAVARGFRLRTASEQSISYKSRLEEVNQKLKETSDGSLQQLQNYGLHDLRNAMMVVWSYLGLMETFIGNRDTLDKQYVDELRARLKLVYRHVETSLQILRRQVSVIRSSNSEEHSVSIRQPLEDLLALVSSHADARNTRFNLSLPVSLPAVTISDAGLIQILMNLALNAIQSTTKQQTVNITAVTSEGPPSLPENSTTARVSGTLDTRHAGPWLVIKVSDQGAGVPADVMPRLFNQYFTTKGQKGTGLGLTSVASLTHGVGGAVTIESQPGAGATVSVILPCKHPSD